MISMEEAGDTVVVPDAPTIPGLTFRRFRGESDYPHLAALFNACKEIDGFDFSRSAEDFSLVLAHLPTCDPDRDVLIAEISGEVIAYSRVQWSEESGGNRLYYTIGRVLPTWRRKGIGSAMLHRNEARLREIATQHRKDVAKYFQCWVTGSQVGLEAMLQKAGYEPVRYVVEMNRATNLPVPAAPMPEGLEVRPALREHCRVIWEAAEEALQDGYWGYIPATEEDYQRWLAEPGFNPSLWKVAWSGDQVAGMVLNYIRETENEEYERKRGYTERIRVKSQWRRRGLARALLVQSIEMFREIGMEETHLHVDAQSLTGALGLYEGVGYRTVRHHTIYRKAMS
jgi:mycothiol synthase